MRTFDFTKLKTDRTFLEANCPILYTCVDDNNELYLVVCCQNNANGKKWLVTGISEDKIIDMLENRVSVRNALMESYGQKYTVCSHKGELSVMAIESKWNEDNSDLPSIDSFLDSDTDEFAEDIKYYRDRLFSNYNRKYTDFSEFTLDLMSDIHVISDLTPLIDLTVKCQNTSHEPLYPFPSYEYHDINLLSDAA